MEAVRWTEWALALLAGLSVALLGWAAFSAANGGERRLSSSPW